MKNAILLTLSAMLLMGCAHDRQPHLTVAAAANIQFAMQDLAKMFTQKTGVKCDVIIGSSGKLTAQIMEGAPYDLFLSANMKYPEELFREGKATAPPEVYSFGKLVLWTMDKSAVPELDLLASEEVKHIAMANPKTAPYGEAAVQAMQYFGLLGSVGDKLVVGESIAQANQYVVSRTADVGFTAESVVLSPKMKGKGRWLEVPPAAYSRISQGVVVLKQGNAELSQLFYKFLFSEEAQDILKKYGYNPN